MTFKNALRVAGTLLSVALALPAQAGSWQQNVAVGNFNKVHVYTPDSLSSVLCRTPSGLPCSLSQAHTTSTAHNLHSLIFSTSDV